MAVGLKNTPLLPISGIKLSACYANIYKNPRNDLALLSFAKGTHCAVVFTKNAFAAAPVIIAKNHLSKSLPQYCLINSGNANAGLGDQGLNDALEICSYLAKYTHTDLECILPFSTGVIAQPLPVKNIKNALPQLLDTLQEDAWDHVAEAILTTDTVTKGISKKIRCQEGEITITGIAKGSGMIRPDMATMLAFIATDADINTNLMQDFLHKSVEQSFNCINVDGDTSTNDACLIAATGDSNVQIQTLGSETGKQFLSALTDICIYLAQAIVRDGEGATKFITINVTEGRSEIECKETALTVANSPLVKTAFFASDANWGRILAAIGRAPIPNLQIKDVNIKLNNLSVVESGERAKTYTEAAGQQVMSNKEIDIHISLGMGKANATIWTCDLSKEYVAINAEYRS